MLGIASIHQERHIRDLYFVKLWTSLGRPKLVATNSGLRQKLLRTTPTLNFILATFKLEFYDYLNGTLLVVRILFDDAKDVYRFCYLYRQIFSAAFYTSLSLQDNVMRYSWGELMSKDMPICFYSAFIDRISVFFETQDIDRFISLDQFWSIPVLVNIYTMFVS